VGDPQDFFQAFRISPDGRKLAADIADFGSGGTDIWIYDLSQTTVERVTFEPGSETWPVWSPDGTRFVYASAQTGPPQLRVKTVGDRGSGEAFQPGPFQIPVDWSSDGRWILYETTGGDGNGEIWVASAVDRKVMPLLKGQSRSPALSPNREYLAFAATETGSSQVYVQRFEDADAPKLSGERLRVSRDGGTVPRWRRDGKELFFLSPDPERRLMAVALKQGKGGGIELGTPTALFRVPASTLGLGNVGYEPSPDGQKFLVPIRKAGSAPLQVVVNWQSGLRSGG
jgi:Tol biopolymer transport system component